MFTGLSKWTAHVGPPLYSSSTVYPAALDSGVIMVLHTQPLHLPFCFYHYFFFNLALCNYQLSASLWNKLTLIPTG